MIDGVAQVVASPYLISILVAWLSAHSIKYAIMHARGSDVDFGHQLFISGGMPSSHTATVVAMWIMIMLKDGPNSGIFGLATLVALIVAYDAVKVRRSTGEQGDAIAQLIKETKSKATIPRAAKGHTPFEVVMGAVLGAMVGTIVFFATK